MNVLKLKSYAYFGTKQFPVNISIMQSSAFIDMVKAAGASTFQRSYYNLTETSPNNVFKTNFNGHDIWALTQKADKYILKLPTDDTSVDISSVNDVCNLLGWDYSILVADNTYTPQYTDHYVMSATKIAALSGAEYDTSAVHHEAIIGGFVISNTLLITKFGAGVFERATLNLQAWTNSSLNDPVRVDMMIVPDDYIYNGYVNPKYITNPSQSCVTIRVYMTPNSDWTQIKTIRFMNVFVESLSGLNTYLKDIYYSAAAQNIEDIDNPYGEDGTSTEGGGDGDLPGGPGGLDFIDPTEIPDLPTVSAVATGFITMYNPSSANLSALGSFLWSGQFDLDTYKKLFADPMQGIIGLGIVPALPNSGGSRNIMFGNVDTGVNCSYLASQYASKDCGSINIQKYVGSFMDYSPYVKISMFLPYIGFVNLGTDDIMGGSINVKYNIDVLTGDCIAFIKHNTKGVLYAYHGNCLTNVPVSGQNYANALKNYYESVAGIIPATTNGAAGGPIGAIAGAATGALNAASNVVLNSKPTFQRSGNIGGSAGILGVQKPFVIIERPNISVPNKVQHYLGQTSNITMGLGECSGLTVVEAVHLNGISATSKELAEIDSLLKGGVIL